MVRYHHLHPRGKLDYIQGMGSSATNPGVPKWRFDGGLMGKNYIYFSPTDVNLMDKIYKMCVFCSLNYFKTNIWP